MTLVERPIRREDVSDLARLDLLCFPPEVAYSESYFREIMETPGTRGIAVEDGGANLAGFVLWDTSEVGFAHVITVDVHPSFQRQGIGRRLMERMEAACRESDAGSVILEVAQSNRAANGFYKALGYQKVGTLPNYYGEGRHAFLMLKDLR